MLHSLAHGRLSEVVELVHALAQRLGTYLAMSRVVLAKFVKLSREGLFEAHALPIQP